jgi:glycosyltransferase involved in cell wall biosynthesis
MRLCLFTDTLGDVNGVSRFIRGVADQSLAHGRDLHAITSTRFACPVQPNIHNLKPRYARPMPGYPQLELVVPPRRDLDALADRLQPDVVHISTPGPVGAAGRRWARKHGVPLVGTYHTDFPAYIEHLFDEPAYTWTCTQAMMWFYGPFARLFTRSADYGQALVRLGFSGERVVRLLPGIDTDTFHTRHRDVRGAVWSGCEGVRPASVKVLYVGRVSVEKNLPMLTRIWPQVASACRAKGLDIQLLVVGDGPYREKMRAELESAGPAADVRFLGFRHGLELSTIYATSDLFIFPSTTDTLGQVVMEAQSAGLPVLVTDQGGPSEVVDEGSTGFVLPADGSGPTAGRWVQTLVRLIENPDLRRTMGAAGHAKIQPMSIRHSFQHFWDVHEQVAAETNAS